MKKILLALLLIGLFFYSPGFAYAQNTLHTDSKTVTTKVGNPTTSGSSIAQAAIDLETTIGAACNNAVTGATINCLNGLSFTNVPYPAQAIGQITQSATGNLCKDDPSLGTCLQCVGFVQAAVAGATGQTLDKGGNAQDFATNVPDGFQYIPISSGTAPQEGDIIIKTSPGVGHIAVVTEALSSTAIKIAEANYNYGGELRITATSPSLWDGFLRKL